MLSIHRSLRLLIGGAILSKKKNSRKYSSKSFLLLIELNADFNYNDWSLEQKAWKTRSASKMDASITFSHSFI
jgi:hypothetical protein